MSAAVIIGRFQTTYLHPGHLWLIATALREKGYVIILLGCTKDNVKDDRNPYGYEFRRAMINSIFPQVVIRPLYDRDHDTQWSGDIDRNLEDVSSPTLYYSRDSFIKSYNGIHPGKQVEEVPGYSATKIREENK